MLMIKSNVWEIEGREEKGNLNSIYLPTALHQD